MKRMFVVLFILFLSAMSRAEVVDKILATVNGEPVTMSELERLLFPVFKQAEQTYKGEELEAYKKEAQKQLLGQLIENKLVLQKAKKDGLAITEAAMEEELADIREKFGTMDEFKKALEKEGLTLEQYKKDLTDQLTVRAIIEREVVPKAKVSPEEIEQYYSEHSAEFSNPEMVSIGHILIKTDEKTAQDVYNQLQEGADFDELAKQYSEAGEVGYVPVNKLKQELRDIVDSLDVGEYSKIIKTDIGWHIIKLKDRKPPEQLSISSVWTGIEDKLFRKKLAEEHEKWMSKIKEKAHIVIAE